MKIKILTNELPGGWSPEELSTSLGGSEEVVTELASELAKNHEVTVFHSQKEVKEIEYNGAIYLDRLKASCISDEIFITFKDPTPWVNGATCEKMIHWSSDVEQPWNTSKIHHFINLTNFHKTRNLWVNPKISSVIPHGIDTKSLDSNKVEKENNTILYCSSPDRGLENLLVHWNEIKKTYPEINLKVAYGFNSFLACTRRNADALAYMNRLQTLMNQDGIEYLGALTKNEIEKEYWKAKYWILPLQRADSELFCLNALKAQYCGALPIVNKIGALKNTVGSYIPYGEFIKGNMNLKQSKADVSALGWDQVVKQYWNPLFE